MLAGRLVTQIYEQRYFNTINRNIEDREHMEEVEDLNIFQGEDKGRSSKTRRKAFMHKFASLLYNL